MFKCITLILFKHSQLSTSLTPGVRSEFGCMLTWGGESVNLQAELHLLSSHKLFQVYSTEIGTQEVFGIIIDCIAGLPLFLPCGIWTTILIEWLD